MDQKALQTTLWPSMISVTTIPMSSIRASLVTIHTHHFLSLVNQNSNTTNQMMCLLLAALKPLMRTLTLIKVSLKSNSSRTIPILYNLLKIHSISFLNDQSFLRKGLAFTTMIC